MAVFCSKQIVVPVTGKMLGDYAEGDIVYLNESGSPVEFYVAKHDYESALNGAGRTLLVRKDCYDTRSWNSENMNTWASCTLRSWLNGVYLDKLDADVRDVIGITRYYNTIGNGNGTVSTFSDAVFLLSLTEFGGTGNGTKVEGTSLPTANMLKIAYLNGTTTIQWTRSPQYAYTEYIIAIAFNGLIGSSQCTELHGTRPVFTLPSNTLFDPDTNKFKGVA